MTVVRPKITDALLVNPGIGFVAAPRLMGDPEIVLDNRGTSVPKYKFTEDSVTWNHPDTGVFYCGGRWKDLEPRQGVYNWELLDSRLQQGADMGCINIVRVSPYALIESEDVPTWMREKWPEKPEFPFWKIDANTTDYAERWADFVRAFAARYDGHPQISSVDLAIVGAWGEGGGSEFMERDKLDLIISAYLDGFSKTPIQALLHDPVSVGLIRSHRRKVGFRVDCLGDMGGFHPGRWSHMHDFYPQNIMNFDMQDAWRDAPVVFEACWHMVDWYMQGWDIDYIVDQSLNWHISSYNSKGTTVPEEWRPAVERWLKKMGYRFEIHEVTFDETANAGGHLNVELLTRNSGVAPCYHNYPPVVRLVSDSRMVDLPVDADIRTWMPDEDALTRRALSLPADLTEGRYELKLGFPAPLGKTLELAIEGRGTDGFYTLGSVNITRNCP